MAKAAARSFSKVVAKCPKCGENGPKEIVEGRKKIDFRSFVLWVGLTAGLALFFPKLWWKSHAEVYCDNCSNTFNPGAWR